jgi:hypothetical protein
MPKVTMTSKRGYAKYKMEGNIKTSLLTGQSPVNDFRKHAEKTKNVKFIHEGMHLQELQYKHNINKT